MIPLVQWKKVENYLKTETFKIQRFENTKYKNPKIAKADFVHPLSKAEKF